MNLVGHRDRRLSENYFEPCKNSYTCTSAASEKINYSIKLTAVATKIGVTPLLKELRAASLSRCERSP